MDKKVYLRGRIATPYYNFNELLAYILSYRKTPKNVEYEKRVFYGEEKQQYYNTYCRKDLLSAKKPLFIYIHGGGFISGITDMRNTYLQNFALKGYFTASISYTYAPKKVFPEQLREICAAIDQLFDRAEEKNIDVNNITLSGESAGGYYIFMLAALSADKSLAEKLGIEFRHLNDFSIKAMVCHSGCYDLKKLLDRSYPQSKFPDMNNMVCSFLGKNRKEAIEFLNSPEGELSYPHVDKDFPPTFFATGKADPLRFESYDAMKKYDEFGIPYAHFEGTGLFAMHAFTIGTVLKKGKLCLSKTFEFLEKI